VRKTGTKKGMVVGSGGQRRRGLEGKGPTPPAERRPHHPKGKAAARAAVARGATAIGPAAIAVVAPEAGTAVIPRGFLVPGAAGASTPPRVIAGIILILPVRPGQVWVTHASSLIGGQKVAIRAVVRQEDTLPGGTYYPGMYCVTRTTSQPHTADPAVALTCRVTRTYSLALARRLRRGVGSPVPSTYEDAR